MQFAPRSVDVGFVVDKVALGQVFLRVLRFSLSISFHRGSRLSYDIWGMTRRSDRGYSSETSPHHIAMNNNDMGKSTLNFDCASVIHSGTTWY
jgi:hypothetical protein